MISSVRPIDTQMPDSIQHSFKTNPWRWLLWYCVVFIVAGYFLYFSVSLLPTPEWAKSLIMRLSTILGSLDAARRVGSTGSNDPFPTQFMILYCATGTTTLIFSALYRILTRREDRNFVINNWIEQDRTSWKERAKLFFGIGIGGMVFFPISQAIIFLHSPEHISWREHLFFSSSIGSVSMLMMISLLTCCSASVAPIALIFPFKKCSDYVKKEMDHGE